MKKKQLDSFTSMRAELLLAAVVLALVVILTAGCSMGTESGDGSMVIRFTESARDVWYPDGDSAYMEIESYKITISHTGNDVLVYEIDSTSAYVIGGIPSGIVTITIEGYNGVLDSEGHVTGKQIAYLQKNSDEDREIDTVVYRGEVTDVSAVLVPVDNEGTGSLEITVNWPTNTDLIIEDPKLVLSVDCLNDYFTYYTDSSFTLEETANLDNNLGTYTETFESLPVGWYQVTLELYSGRDELLVSQLHFARVTYDPAAAEAVTSTGSVTITEEILRSGAAETSIDETALDDILSLAVTAEATAGTGTEYNAADSTYYLDTTSGEASIDFTATSGYGEEGYTWHVNGGEFTADNTDNTQTFIFDEPGTYTVLVMASSEGKLGVAEMQIVVGFPPITYEVGDTGPAGGFIFYVDSDDVFDDWDYLEARTTIVEDIYNWGQVVTGTDSLFLVGTSSEIGTGETNTAAIVSHANGVSTSSAAYLADTYEITVDSIVYDDWFLPSAGEMVAYFDANESIHMAVPELAWTSTEYDDTQITPVKALYLNVTDTSAAIDLVFRRAEKMETMYYPGAYFVRAF